MFLRVFFTVVWCALLAGFCREPIASSAEIRSLLIPGDGTPTQTFGRVVRIDGSEIAFEDASTGTPVHAARTVGSAVVFQQPGEAADESGAASFERAAPSVSGRDVVLLRNGDWTACDFVGMNRRYAYYRCFGRVVATPRERVAGVRFGVASAASRPGPERSPSP